MKKFIFHLKNYFNLKEALPPFGFFTLYLLTTFVATPLIVGLVAAEQMEAFLAGEILRLDFISRVFFAVYEVFLIPLYVKRLADLKWPKFQRELAIILIVLPTAIATVLSDAGYAFIMPLLGFLRLMALLLTLCLFVVPSKPNQK